MTRGSSRARTLPDAVSLAMRAKAPKTLQPGFSQIIVGRVELQQIPSRPWSEHSSLVVRAPAYRAPNPSFQRSGPGEALVGTIR